MFRAFDKIKKFKANKFQKLKLSKLNKKITNNNFIKFKLVKIARAQYTKILKDIYNIIPLMPEIEMKIGKKLDVPRIVVVGDQSSGKTAFVEALANIKSTLFKGTKNKDILAFISKEGMGTKRPLVYTLQRSTKGSWIEVNGELFDDIDAVAKRIKDENNAVDDVSDLPIYLTIYAPDAINLSFTDLPGFIASSQDGMDPELPKKIKNTVIPYIKNHDAIVVDVHSGPKDPSTSLSLGILKKEGANNTIGIITKLDLVKNLKLPKKMVKGEIFKKKYGYYLVTLRSKQDKDNGVTVEEQLKREEEFFSSPQFSDVKENCGIPKVKEHLSSILLLRLMKHIPEIREELSNIIKKKKEDEGFLQKLANEQDLKTISKDLKDLIEHLVPSSFYRTDFELEFTQELESLLKDEFNKVKIEAFKKVYTNPDDTKYNNKSINLSEKLAYGALTKLCNGVNDFIEKNDLDKFTRFFKFGENSPEKMNNDTISKVTNDRFIANLLLPFYKFSDKDDRNKKRVEWQKCLDRAVKKLLDDKQGNLAGDGENENNLQTKVYNLILGRLNKFIEETNKIEKESRETMLARKFGAYLVKNISDDIYQKDMKKEFYDIIHREGRISINQNDMIFELANKYKYPTLKSWINIFTSKTTSIEVPFFGSKFTDAYIDTVAKRVSTELFRTAATKLFDDLVFRCINYTLNMFKKEQLELEAKKNKDIITKLEGWNQRLADAHNHYLEYEEEMEQEKVRVDEIVNANKEKKN